MSAVRFFGRESSWAMLLVNRLHHRNQFCGCTGGLEVEGEATYCLGLCDYIGCDGNKKHRFACQRMTGLAN